MSPLDPRGYFTNNGTAGAYLLSGSYAQAELWTRRTLDKWPSHPVALRYRAAALVLLDRVDEARSVISELLKVQSNSSLSRSRRAHYQDAEMYGVYLEALRKA